MLTERASSNTRWIGLFILVLIISLGELAALVLEYQSNSYLRQYVSDNFVTTTGAATGLVALALVAGYVASRRLRPKAPGPWVPVFAKIGGFVIGRHRLIVLFWILLLVASFPLSTRLSSVVTSSTTGGTSSTSESAQAQTLIAQEFPRPQANTSAIILLQGNDVTNNATRFFTLELERQLLTPGVLDSVQNFTSVYSLARLALTGVYLQNNTFVKAVFLANQTVWSARFPRIRS